MPKSEISSLCSNNGIHNGFMKRSGYEVLGTKIILMITINFFMFCGGHTFAQDGIKSKLNEHADGSLVNTEVEQIVNDTNEKVRELSEELDSAKSVIDSVAVRDSIERAEEAALLAPLEEGETRLIDTAKFEKRFFDVRKKSIKKDLRGEQSWTRKYNLTHTEVYKEEHELNPTKQVFGWHPFWMGEAYKSYNFSLLSTIAYFSYELNPTTGGYKTIHDWKTTSLIDSAQAHGCDVLLSVTNFGTANNAAFLSNKVAQANFIGNLLSLLKERNADGVNIDFEAIPRTSSAALNNFIIDLSGQLRSARSDYRITLALPAIDFDHVYDIEQLNNYVDTYIIMGYEFYGSNSTVAGPVSPLASGSRWWQYNLQSSVSDYLTAGIPASKLLLGLPYYGAEWQTQDLRTPSLSRRFIRYPMFRDIKRKGGVGIIDEPSQSKVKAYRDGNNNYRQIWYEDSVTLGVKYDWVNEQGLGGVGIWALGYDNGYTDLWQLLARKFAMTEEVALATAKTRRRFSWRRMLNLGLRAARNPYSILRNPRPLIGIFGGLFGLNMIGFFILFRYGNRLRRVWKLLLKSWIVLLVVIAIVVLFVATEYIGVPEMLFLLGGLVLGIIIFLLFSHRFLSEKDLP